LNPSNDEFGSVFCLSLDLELLTGWHDLPDRIYNRKAREMTDAKDRILELVEELEAREIEATWGVVTHLLLDSCSGHSDCPEREWLGRDPCSSRKENPLWYAPDLVERLLDSDLFEVACHSFSHPVFPEISEQFATYELERSVSLARDAGFRFHTFIFPRNRIGHRSLLARYGFRCYRSSLLKKRPKIRAGLDWLIGRQEPSPVSPRIDNWGLVEIPASMYLGLEKIGKLVKRMPPRDAWRWKISRGLERTATSARGSVFHVWMHPSDYGTAVSKSDFAYLLDLVEDYRAQGMRCMRMIQIAKRLGSKSQ